ncbi:hypothetical protein CHU93_14865 [Sandarakinorhabdus cyanobacteriorum]|uniref:PIN domain-containing protein n=1 Tax=Sandarakinorhabdus cyanobacteriorum TaxID=1981098 RepID=A0A255Y926_9SPHN|nr:hypothetical protein [Sandarakinorhabdus cyanobacteriorum]OYQ25105.1 hypothetical protein CHU93_14865 [Sandarakinorhabdus cyanobacteriorum]
MTQQVLVIDTSVMCCLLGVPGKDTCGSAGDRWDTARARDAVAAATARGSIIVLPLATIIETGNHIAQAPSRRFDLASELSRYILLAADGETPWAAFTDQADLWGRERLRELAATWPGLAAASTSLGDASIKDVAEYYAKGGVEVEILTGDKGLKAYQPARPPMIPRRRN